MVAVFIPLAEAPRLTVGAELAGRMTIIEVTLRFTSNVVAVPSYRTVQILKNWPPN
jgi:hypothetical protein